MIRRIYAALCAAVAVVAVFGVLAFQQRTVAPTATGTPVVMARTASGALVPVTTAPSTVHATTSSSGVATQSADATAGGTGSAVVYVKNANGNFVPVGKSAAATLGPGRSRDEELVMSLLRHSFTAMGTDCGLVVSAAPSDMAMAHRAIGAALSELTALERALSRFDASSGLSTPERGKRIMGRGRRAPIPRCEGRG